MKSFYCLLLSLPAIACMALSCSTMNLAGPGNSSGTGNGAVVYASSDRIEGKAMPLATARLYSQDWLPFLDSGSFADSLAADSSGVFAFLSVPRGYYNLIIFSADQKNSGIFQNIPCQPAVSWADTIDSLKAPGFLHGFATILADTLAFSYAYVKGTPFYALTDVHGEFSIKALPPSRYVVRLDGLYTKSGNGPLMATNIFSITGSPLQNSIIDSAAVSVFPDSVSQFTR
jgi:hypothetical protein